MSCCRYILSMGKLTVILIGMCVLCGCEGRKNWSEEKWQGLEYPLTATSVNVDRIIFTESDLIFIDDYVIFENWDKDKYYSVFRISQDSLKFTGSFLTKGNGPFEVNASSIHFLNRDSVLMIVAYNPRGKSFVIPVNNLKNVFDFSAWSVVDYPYVESFAYNLLPVTDSTYLMQGFGDSDDLFTLLNTGSEQVSSLGVRYPDSGNEVTCYNKSQIYSGDLRKRPSARQFVYSCSNSKFVEIFTLGDSTVSNRIRLFDRLPICTQRTDGTYKIVDHHESGYQLSVTDAFIYCADPKIDYSDRERSIKRNGYSPGYVKEVYLCDWNGNPVHKYLLDRPVCYIQPDTDDEWLYAFYLNPESFEPEMVKFKLPDIH